MGWSPRWATRPTPTRVKLGVRYRGDPGRARPAPWLRERPARAGATVGRVPTFAVLDDGRATAVDAVVEGGAVRLEAKGFAAATGWELEPQGLCRAGVCVPVRVQPGVVDQAAGVDAAGVAALLRRSVLVDTESRVVAFGESVAAAGEALRQRHAPDFTLPLLDGTPLSFSGIGRKKKLLVAWASW